MDDIVSGKHQKNEVIATAHAKIESVIAVTPVKIEHVQGLKISPAAELSLPKTPLDKNYSCFKDEFGTLIGDYEKLLGLDWSS